MYIKEAFAIVYLFIIIILINIVFRTKKDRRPHVMGIRRALIYSVIAGAANIACLFPNHYVAEVGYSVFFMSINYILLYLAYFSCEYVGVKKTKVQTWFTCTLLGIDSISLMSNVFFHHSFLAKQVEYLGEYYYKIEPLLPYRIHLGLCYVLCFAIFMNLIWGIVKLKRSAFYRKSYGMVLLLFALILVLDSLYFLTNMPVNLGVGSYGFGAIIIYYYTVLYVPREITNRTLVNVVGELTYGILIFDEKDQCIYMNNATNKLLRDKDPMAAAQSILAQFQSEYADVLMDEVRVDQSFTDSEGEHFYLVTYNALRDNKGVYSGCFFHVEDLTEQIIRGRNEHYKATHDQLTGLYNQDYFADRCKRMLRQKPNEDFYMVVSDIDNFKMINDTFGVSTGDQLLCHIADVIEKYSRQEVYCRIGGDRFGLLVSERFYNEELFQHIVDEMSAYGKEDVFPVSIHVGVYRIEDRKLSISAMIDRAMLAIQEIKGDFNKHFSFYTEKMRDDLLKDQELLAELDTAIKNEEFVIYLQPQMDSNGCMLGAEALVRWQHYRRGLMFPNDFIPLFEKNGVITNMDIAVWESACKTLARWKEAGWTEPYISINISARDMHFADVYSILTELVKKYDISPNKLKLEITESALMVNLEKQLDLMRRLKEFGFTIEMDDFGSGYSSLNTLNRTDLDVLKIDMLFLNHSGDMRKSGAIIKTIVDLAKVLNMECIMEGVETEEEFLHLRDLGVDGFQGYYFAKPMPVAAFEEKYLKV